MENENKGLVIETMVGEDGRTKVILDEADFKELLEIVAHYDELMGTASAMAHLDECEEEECEQCDELSEEECCDEDDEECCGTEDESKS